nr:DUF1153 domain-containing protein [uncultured Brevundimonas sp.]
MNGEAVRGMTAFSGRCRDADHLKATLLEYIGARTNRWTAQRKAAALTLVRASLLAPEEFCRTYGVEPSELAAWGKDFDARGIEGLMATRIRAPRNIRF